MYYHSIKDALDANPTATHILTTSDEWIKNGRNPHLDGKFIAVVDDGCRYVVLHNIDTTVRSTQYNSDWIVCHVCEEQP